jgi:putative (di)nucleoside polyphosphate hydrolase
MTKFRQGIIAVIRNGQGEILLCERSDHRGSWQFPQGGIEAGETPEDAFFRELREEIGNDRCRILLVAEKTTTYRWPRSNDDRVGQEHTWFLAEFAAGEKPDLARGDGCFMSWKWEAPGNALALMVEWKRPAFQQGLENLGLL